MNDIEQQVSPLIRQLGETLTAQGSLLASAESCTGGLAAALLTALPGSSAWFERGFVAYSNESKTEMLSVSAQTLTKHGSVSEAAVAQMAVGAIARSRASVAIAMSGVAGPSGGSPDKPIGMVCLAWYLGPNVIHTATEHFAGDRSAIRGQTVRTSIEGLLSRLAA